MSENIGPLSGTDPLKILYLSYLREMFPPPILLYLFKLRNKSRILVLSVTNKDSGLLMSVHNISEDETR